MKLLLTINSGTPGGAEQHVLDIVNGMVSNGHEVFVWCKDGIISDWYREAGAQVTIKNVNRDIDVAYILALVSFLRQEKIQIIHAHELRAVGNSLLAGFFARTKVKISQIHTPFSQWQIPQAKKLLYILCYDIAVRLFSTREIAVSNSSRQIKVKEGLPAKKLVVTLNAVDTNKMTLSHNERALYREETCKKFSITMDSYIIGNLSRTTAEKGQAILLKAFAQLTLENPQKSLHLIIAGGGELLEDLKALAKVLKLDNKVTFTGRFEDADKVKLYASFDCFAFPTLAEGFGIVMLEAMLSEVPIVCSDLPVLREVAGENAQFFNKGDASALRTKLDLVANLSLLELEKITLGAKDWVERKYSQAKFGEVYETLYQRLLL